MHANNIRPFHPLNVDHYDGRRSDRADSHSDTQSQHGEASLHCYHRPDDGNTRPNCVDTRHPLSLDTHNTRRLDQSLIKVERHGSQSSALLDSQSAQSAIVSPGSTSGEIGRVLPSLPASGKTDKQGVSGAVQQKTLSILQQKKRNIHRRLEAIADRVGRLN